MYEITNYFSYIKELLQVLINSFNKFISNNQISLLFFYSHTRTTDAQRGNSLHCTAENSLPNF